MAMTMLAAFWVVSFALVLTPGADWAYAISAGLRERAVLPAVAGMLLGYAVITLVVAAGIGSLVAGLPALLNLMTFIGAFYLLWLGIGIFTRPPSAIERAGDEDSGWPAWLGRGFAISGLNPKALLLMVALLPQFTSRELSWPIAAQIAGLGLIQIINCAVVYSLVGFGSGAFLRSRPQAACVVGKLSGAAMIAIALLLLGEQLVKLNSIA